MSQPPRWVLRWTPFSCYFVHSETQMKQKAKESLALRVLFALLMVPLIFVMRFVLNGIPNDVLRFLASVAFVLAGSVALAFVYNGLHWCIIAASADRAQWIDDDTLGGPTHVVCDHQWQLRRNLLDCSLVCTRCRKSRRVRGDALVWGIAFILWYFVTDLVLNAWGGTIVFLLGILAMKALLNLGHCLLIRQDVDKRGRSIEDWISEPQ